MSDEASLDLVVIGSALVEITPAEMGRPLSEVEGMSPLPSGSAANFAIALAELGMKVGFISRVGDDELGEWLVRRLGERGLRTDFMRKVEGQMTPVSFAWMDQEGAKTFYFYRFPDFSDPMATLTEDEVDAAEVTAGRLFDFTEATIRNEPLRSAALRAAALAREAGREVCYAVNYRPASWRGQSEAEIVATQRRACAAADIVVMNEQEARLITGVAGGACPPKPWRRRAPSPRIGIRARGDPPSLKLRRTDGAPRHHPVGRASSPPRPMLDVGSPLEQAAKEIAHLGPRLVIITSGEDGSLLLAEGEMTHVPARQVEVAYDIGAGDAFHAGLLTAHLRGMSPSEAARFASDTAALRISRPASEPGPTFEEVARLQAPTSD